MGPKSYTQEEKQKMVGPPCALEALAIPLMCDASDGTKVRNKGPTHALLATRHGP